MESLLRKHFWAVHLAFLCCAMGGAVEPALARVDEAVRGEGSLPATVRGPRLSAARLAELLGLPTGAREPSAPTEPAPSSLRVRLLGTLVGAKPEWSVASLQDLESQRARTYFVGDVLAGSGTQIIEIERTRVTVLHNDRVERIEGGDRTALALATTPSLVGRGIHTLSENEYEVPRAEIDKTLSNLNDVAMQARIVPAFKDGVAQGFKLFSIRPDSIYSKIGVQNGDVIRASTASTSTAPRRRSRSTRS